MLFDVLYHIVELVGALEILFEINLIQNRLDVTL